MAKPILTIDPPQRQPKLPKLFAVAEVRQADAHFGATEGLEWISDGCSIVRTAPGLCFQTGAPTGSKTRAGIDTLTAEVPAFGAYVGVECYLNTEADYAQRALALLEMREEAFFTQQFLSKVLPKATSEGAQSVLNEALGVLDAVAYAQYAGQPVAFVNTVDLSRIPNLLVKDGFAPGIPTTPVGTPVIAAGDAVPTGTALITGGISILRSDRIVNSGYDLTHNREMAIAETLFAAAVDCNFIRKVTFPDGQ